MTVRDDGASASVGRCRIDRDAAKVVHRSVIRNADAESANCANLEVLERYGCCCSNIDRSMVQCRSSKCGVDEAGGRPALIDENIGAGRIRGIKVVVVA